jgi:Fe-S cluster assembly protein SufD
MAPHTTSRERFRSILADNARGVFNGRIYVDECAQKTNAQLSNRNLLLSPGAEINTKPELEIYADDVKCAHGSTTGQLDTNALFYLLSRGIPEKNARDLLIMAFASELVTELEIGSVSEKIQQALRRLGTSLGATN